MTINSNLNNTFGIATTNILYNVLEKNMNIFLPGGEYHIDSPIRPTSLFRYATRYDIYGEGEE